MSPPPEVCYRPPTHPRPGRVGERRERGEESVTIAIGWGHSLGPRPVVELAVWLSGEEMWWVVRGDPSRSWYEQAASGGTGGGGAQVVGVDGAARPALACLALPPASECAAVCQDCGWALRTPFPIFSPISCTSHVHACAGAHRSRGRHVQTVHRLQAPFAAAV